MRKLVLLLVFISTYSSAQWAIGLFAEPSYQLSSLQEFEGSDYDSLDALWSNDLGYGIGLTIKFNTDRVTSFHFKPGLYQHGFTLARRDLKFLDVIHTELDTLFDKSQAAEKKAFMHHQFKFIGGQFEYHRNISPSINNLPVEFHIGVGIGYYYLINHQLKVVTEGFAIDESFVHYIDQDLYFEASEHYFTLSALFETIYRPTPNWELFAQLAMRSGLNTLTIGDAQAFNMSPNLSVGFRRLL